MKMLGNILWHFPFFGFVSAIITYLIGLILTITVIAAPVGLGLMELGKCLFLPFSRDLVSKEEMTEKQNKSWLIYSKIIMVVYVITVGIWLFIVVAFQVAVLFVSIIGIPAALATAKHIGAYFNPVNKKCVHYAVADELERREAQKQIDKMGPEK